jgi:hypothetical protein
MSFNEVSEFRTLLGEIDRHHPKLILAGERSLLWVIISYPDGCFIGESELANQAGLRVSTLGKYLGRQSRLKVITKEQSYARKGLRQCYRVSLTGLKNILSLPPEIALELRDSKINSELPTAGELVPTAEFTNAYHRVDPYKEYKNYKYDKGAVKGINVDRFNYVISEINAETRKYISAGMNYEKILDKIERQGTSLSVVKGRLGRVNFSTAVKVGAVLEHQLKVIAGDLKAKEKSSMPPHCGDPFCDPETRTFPEFSYDTENNYTNKCLNCNPDYCVTKQNEKSVDEFGLKEIFSNAFKSVE